MLWVVYTCVSRNLNQQKRNELNPITPPRENVRNVYKYWDILTLAQNSKIGPRIVHFLLAGWSDWADSFCNESGFLIHKFSLPTTYYSKNFESPLFLGLTPLGGPLKIFVDKKNILPSSAPVGNFSWNWAELALLSVFPPAGRRLQTRKSIQIVSFE